MNGEKETVTGKAGDQRAIGTRFQDILFIGIVFCLLFAVIANAAYARLSPQYRLNRFSFFEQRMLAEKPELSAGTVLSGKAQEGIEQYVADAVPWRDGLLLFSGRLQRLGIESANLLFGYEAYPAVYDSHILMVPGRRIFVELPENTDSGVKERLHTGAECINRLVEAHPEIDWVYVFIDPSSTSVANPAFHMGNDYADHAFYWEHFAGLLDERIHIVDMEVGSEEEFDRLFFSTDHHWRIEQSSAAFNRVAGILGIPSVDTCTAYTLYDGPFIGYYGRQGESAEFHDVFRDIDFQTGDVQVWINGKEDDSQSMGISYNGVDAEELFDYRGNLIRTPFENVYAVSYHSDYGTIHIRNEAAPDRSLLVIGDSFSNSIERFFVPNYREVYILDPRYYDRTFLEFLDEHTIDDAVIVLGPSTILKLGRFSTTAL